MVSREKDLLTACLLIIALISFSVPSRAEESCRTFFKVSNLSCGSCVGKIDAKLKTFDGYIRMMANIDNGLVAVDHRPNLTEIKISATIISLGYPAKAASVSEYNQHKPVSSKSHGWRSPNDGIFDWFLGILRR